MKNIILPACLAIAVAACGGGEKTPEAGDAADPPAAAPIGSDEGQPEANETAATHKWAVSSAHPLATEAGARILREGGTAVDAAIAVQAVLGLVEPQSSGLGGGAFMLYYDQQSGAITAYDGRETAPFTASRELFLNEDGSRMSYRVALGSGRAVGVPGVVAMMDMAHREHGRLEWSELYADAYRLASEGFEVSPRMAKVLNDSASFLAADEMAHSLYFSEDGSTLAEGTVFKNAPYAETVRTIADNGAGAFYSGDIAQGIVDAVAARAGQPLIALDDIFEYEPVAREAVCGDFKGYEICTMAPPSSALAMLQTLGMMEAKGLPEEPGPELWMMYGEAGRLAYADRADYLGDPTAMGTPEITSEEVAEALIQPDYLRERSTLIGTFSAAEVAAGEPFGGKLKEDRQTDASDEVPGTTHFSTMDRYGNIVSMTGTVESAFGSKFMSGGMFLNNELTDFSFEPVQDGMVVVNAVGPGKRPRSSMTPTIVLDKDGQPVAAIGSAGGANIIGHVAKTLLLALGYDMPWQDAISHHHVTTRVGFVFVEDTAPAETIAAMEGYGLTVNVREISSSLHGFRLDHGKVECGADPRREGVCLTGK
ncbi:gamma-glutamyltransferase family protein [Parvularcula marina]|uniref:gamma-glutamyltransferase family protein n=1 Tax=Parvularcula marina TaxID=2292771 RepID=UPI0035122E57